MTAGNEATDGADLDDEDEGEEGASYSQLDPETAARCGLWLDDG